MKRKLLAETVGTFCLVVAGCGAMVVNDLTGGTVSHAGVALTWGLIVMAMIYAFGHVSGAHINPAVTLALAIANRFDSKLLAPYMVCQIVGAMLGCVFLKILFPASETLGASLPAGSAWQSFALEVFLTFLLVYVILAVTAGDRPHKFPVGLIVGGVVGLEAMFAGPICGASMNPARSIGPALVSLNLAMLWIYISAPFIGAILAVMCCRCAEDEGCCSAAC